MFSVDSPFIIGQAGDVWFTFTLYQFAVRLHTLHMRCVLCLPSTLPPSFMEDGTDLHRLRPITTHSQYRAALRQKAHRDDHIVLTDHPRIRLRDSRGSNLRDTDDAVVTARVGVLASTVCNITTLRMSYNQYIRFCWRQYVVTMLLNKVLLWTEIYIEHIFRQDIVCDGNLPACCTWGSTY